ncbi:MAG: hypothetical protein AAFZ92_07410 [Pseudomonadota bacterium]
MSSKQFSLVFSLIVSNLLVACSSGGSSNSSISDAVTGSDASLRLPSQLEVVTNETETSNRLAPLSRSGGDGGLSYRFDDSGTEYITDEQNFHIWNEALEPIDLVNSILCFVEQFKVNDFVNAGPYVVLANEDRCFDEGGNNDSSGSSGQSSAAANVVSYMEVVVDSVRETPTSPLVISVWMPEMGDEGEEQAIRFRAVISEGASDTNPFGSFVFNFDFFDNFTDNNQTGGGEVRTVDIPGSIGFTLYESSTQGSDTFTQNASVVMSSDKTTGQAITSFDRGINGGQAFALAYNQSNVLVQNAGSIATLGFQTNNNTGTCLSRTSFDEAVWRYDLYNLDTGDRIDINSGMPFKYDSNSDSVADAFGFIGYYGMWTEEDGALTNGDTIVVDENGNDANYTVVTAPGRLIRNTVESLALANIRGINFYLWDDTAFVNGYNRWIVNYLTVADDAVGADGFYRVAGESWGDEGSPQQTQISPALINLSANDIIDMYSNQLGGNVQYVQGDDELTFFSESYVNGSETVSGQILQAGTLNLVCFERCPVGTLESSDLANFEGANSPYSTDATTVAGGMAFRFSTSGGNPLTLVRDSNSEPVRYASGLTVQQLNNLQSPYAWGINTGAMVTSTVAASLTNPWDIYNPDLVTEFYTWETGVNIWNQLQAVRDTSNNIVSFQQPLEFSYQHTNGNDRSDSAGQYDGQTYFVSYGGNGDFWGIPYQNNGGDRWYPLFNIDDGVAMGPGGIYVIKAREIEQSMAAATGQCSALTLSAPAAAVPTSTVSSATIGTMPMLTSDPAVIDGVIQQ